MIDNIYLAAMVVSFALTTVVITALRPVAKSAGLIDKPGGRKSHLGEIPIVGGLAMFAGVFAALTLLPDTIYSYPHIFAASLILVSVGVVDDKYNIFATVRISAQIAVVLIMVYGANLALGSIGDPFGVGEIYMGRFTLIFTMLVTLTMINAYNLVDGIDGLAGSLAFVALAAVCVVAGARHPAIPVALVVMVAIVGFLVFNLPVAWNRQVRCFMGDAGSTLLGFTIVWITLGISQGSERVISPVHALWFASVPVYDLLTCFVRRILNGKSPFTPGQDHFHHVLKRGGFDLRATLGILIALQAFYASIAVIAHFSAVPDVYMFAAWSVLGLTQSFVIRRIARIKRARTLQPGLVK